MYTQIIKIRELITNNRIITHCIPITHREISTTTKGIAVNNDICIYVVRREKKVRQLSKIRK